MKLNNPRSLPQGSEIHAIIKFFVHMKTINKYLVVEETAVQTFDATKSEWGIGKLMPLSTFLNEENGYLVGDKCEFGVEITLLQPIQQRLSFLDNDRKFVFTLKISDFSSQEFGVSSNVFSFAGWNWRIRVAPKGYIFRSNYLSIDLHLADRDRLQVNEKLYVKASIRVISTNASNNIEKQFAEWYYRDRPPHGFDLFMTLEDLYDTTKGFIVGDCITIETQFQLVSKFE